MKNKKQKTAPTAYVIEDAEGFSYALVFAESSVSALKKFQESSGAKDLSDLGSFEIKKLKFSKNGVALLM